MKEGNDNGILVIRLSAMGDVAMTVPVLLALTRTYPKIQISFLTKEHFTPILQGIPNVSTFPFEAKGRHKGIPGLWRLYQELKNNPFDRIADLHAVLRTRILKLFFTASGKPFCSLDKGRKEKRQLTAWREKTISPLKHTIERYVQVFDRLGYPVEIADIDVLPKKPWPGSIDREKDGNFRVGIAPFAAHEGKCYPQGEMKQVLGLLGQHPGIQLYLFGGGQKEVEILEEWAPQYPHCVSVAGSMSFSEELALISNLDLMVSMDSGNGHLAAMYGVPVITIWGVTHPYAGFAPFNQPETRSILADREAFPMIPTSVYGNKVPEGYEKVMKTIPPQQICDAILNVLEDSRTSGGP